VAEHHAAALGHAVNFALLNLEALFLADQRQRFRDQEDALAADADHHDVVRCDVSALGVARVLRRGRINESFVHDATG
jgi:hypothetical protein